MKISTIDNHQTVLVGTPSFLFAFYSTIVCNVPEYDKYKACMNFLHDGRIDSGLCSECIEELKAIRNILNGIPPQRVVWDMNDMGKMPPWGHNISKHITSLGNYFVTTDGKDLFDELTALLEYAKAKKVDVVISG